MRRASRGRFEVPVSCRDVEGNGALMGAGAVPLVCAGCEVCVLACVEEAVGGLGFGAPVAVAGGVESISPPGEAMMG
jgi:ferredoxin